MPALPGGEETIVDEETMQFASRHERNLRRLAQKWAYLTEAIKDPSKKNLVAQLLENQSQPAIPMFEADQNTGNLPTSSTVFPTQIAFPAIVQTFPNLVMNELVQVQPMNSPRAAVLYKNFIRSSNTALLPHSGSWTETAESGTPPKARMRLDTLDLSVKKYMLNFEWTAELEEDASALGNIDVQAEMIAAMRDEIGAELDWMVVQDLFTLPTRSAEVGANSTSAARAGAGNVNFSKGTYASYETPKLHQARLLDAIVDAKVAVFNASFRVPDYILGDAASVAELEKMDTFVANQGRRAEVGIKGIVYAGTLSGQYDVYVSSVAPANKLLLGVKGAGYIFGVYRPFELTTTVYNPDTDEFIRGIRTRVARRIVDAAYFASVTLTA